MTNTKELLEEVYVPEEQIVYNDSNITKKISKMKIIKSHLIKKFIVADLDRDKSIDDFIKIDCAHAVGVLEGGGSYNGVDSLDETWLYELENENGTKNGGVAIVRNKKVIDFYPIWESIEKIV